MKVVLNGELGPQFLFPIGLCLRHIDPRARPMEMVQGKTAKKLSSVTMEVLSDVMEAWGEGGQRRHRPIGQRHLQLEP